MKKATKPNIHRDKVKYRLESKIYKLYIVLTQIGEDNE